MALYKGTVQIAGGSSVQISAIYPSTGTHIANISVDGKETKIYAPNNGNIHLSDIYPIGSIYTSITNSDNCPFEGIDGMHWEKIASGKCLFGADESHVAGSEIVQGLPIPSISTSDLSCESNGLHRHSAYFSNTSLAASPSTVGSVAAASGSTNTSLAGNHTHTIIGNVTIAEDDTYKTDNIVVQPPAIAVIFWERIS